MRAPLRTLPHQIFEKNISDVKIMAPQIGVKNPWSNLSFLRTQNKEKFPFFSPLPGPFK